MPNGKWSPSLTVFFNLSIHSVSQAATGKGKWKGRGSGNCLQQVHLGVNEFLFAKCHLASRTLQKSNWKTKGERKDIPQKKGRGWKANRYARSCRKKHIAEHNCTTQGLNGYAAGPDANAITVRESSVITLNVTQLAIHSLGCPWACIDALANLRKILKERFENNLHKTPRKIKEFILNEFKNFIKKSKNKFQIK